MIFYFLSFIALCFTFYFYTVMQEIATKIVHACREIGITVHVNPTPDQQRQNGEYLKELKDYIRFSHSINGWFWIRVLYSIGFLLYTILPLLGCNWYIDPKIQISLFDYLFNFTNSDFYEQIELSQLLRIRVWVLVSIVYSIGIIIASRVSIRRLRRKFCTNKERETSF